MSDKTIFHKRLEFLGKNYQNKSSKSDKFYEISVLWNGGSTYVEIRRWGRYGAKGQTKELRHFSEWQALNSAESQLAKKRQKGYTDKVAPLKRLASAMDD